MKRFLSIMLAAAMLMSVFCFNVSAAVPTKTGGEWSVLISEDFDSGKATYFTRKSGSADTSITYPLESEDSTNKVADLRIDNTALTINDAPAYWDGAQIGAGNYTGNILATGKTMPNSTVMIEFDMCGKKLTSPLHIGMRVNNASAAESKAIKINPNNIKADTWYTYRIVVNRTADKDSFTVDNTTVYRKLRDSIDDFVKVKGEATAAWSNTTTLDYGIGQTPCTSIVAFAVTAYGSYIRPFLGETSDNSTKQTLTTGTSTGTSTHSNYVAAMKDAHYQIDNVTVYAKSAEATPELSNGILKYWDMENAATIPTDGTIYENGKWVTYSFMTQGAEESGNRYAYFKPGDVVTYGKTIDSLVKYPMDGVTFPETFILSFDANNAALGSTLDFVISGDGVKDTDNSYPRNTLHIRSHAGIQNKWYSYKVVCSATPKKAGSFAFTVYRKERGSSSPYVELIGEEKNNKNATNLTDYGWTSTMSSSKSWMNTLQVGTNRRSVLGANSTAANLLDETAEATNHANVVWYIDNVMITEAAAITGDVSVADSNVTAALNLSTVAASTPILAVYDGTKLVDVAFAPVAHEGAATLTAKYDTTALVSPKAMLYVWDSLANGKPVLADAINVATYID